MTETGDKSDSGSEQEQFPARQQGNRFFTCLVIVGVFIIIDLAILFYFFRSGSTVSNTDPARDRGGVVEQKTGPAGPSTPEAKER